MSDSQEAPTAREVIAAALRMHGIECTGPGEVTCGACRNLSWMSLTTYREHVAHAVLAALDEARFELLSPLPKVEQP